ncbi:hypothetical protein D3C77_665930 [compost metagenome]
MVLHLQLIDQAEQRPVTTVLLHGEAAAPDLLDQHTGPAVQGMVWPAERGLRDRTMAVLVLLIAQAELRAAHVRIEQIRFQLELQAGLLGILGEEAAADVLRLAPLS